MSSMLRPLLVLFALLTVLTGLVYPLAVTGIGKAVFPNQVSGSLVVRDGKAVGSSLIGQSFQEPKYFWGRISATSPMPNNATAPRGSSAQGLKRPRPWHCSASAKSRGFGPRNTYAPRTIGLTAKNPRPWRRAPPDCRTLGSGKPAWRTPGRAGGTPGRSTRSAARTARARDAASNPWS